ncbi:MAG: disulfide bond formation protein B [Candidatus Paracaedibacter sp.]
MNCTTMNKALNCLTLKHVHWFLIFMAAASLGFAYVAEHNYKIVPCDFCLYERCVYAAVIILGLLSLKTNFLRGRRGIFIQLFVLSIGIVLTGYHVGMEQHWWAGPASCTGIQTATTLEDFRAQLMLKARPRCDQISWILFGVSATVWNLVLQAGLAFLVSLSLYLPDDQNKN